LSRPSTSFARVAVLFVTLFWLSASIGGQTRVVGTLSNDLLALIQSGDSRPVRAIVRGNVIAIQEAAIGRGLPILNVLEGLVVIESDPVTLQALLDVPGVAGISRDALVAPFMTVSGEAIAAGQARAGASGLLDIGSSPAVTGRGVGVAVIDSGIAAHAALSHKIAAAVSFVTGDASTNDKFGHGTHIAGIIAGATTATTRVTPLYREGIAPGAHLINVRVLGSQGLGYTSDVIAGIQWTVRNRARYAIKVVNLSLGHPVVEPCITDPLCLAAEAAAASGLVVVASAGNAGKDADGREAFASISTPGAAPSIITVGALNTWGTVSRDDDTVTTYSSRGPARYGLTLKPDVVAPGNKIVSLEAAGSYLARKYPTLHVAGNRNNAYSAMSGTSMAAAMVSGGAALLLEDGQLTARQVKLALQLSASFMPNEGVVRSGTGSVNLYSARRINGTLNSLTGVLPSATIAGRSVDPGGMLLHNSPVDAAAAPAGAQVFSTIEMLGAWLGLLTPSRLGVLGGSQVLWGDHAPAQQVLWGDRTPYGQQILWGDRTPYGQQVLWGDETIGQQVLWGDQTAAGQQVLWGDQTAAGQQVLWGDAEASQGQQVLWGDADSSEGNQVLWGDSSTTPE
jgi:serine protease AprX